MNLKSLSNPKKIAIGLFFGLLVVGLTVTLYQVQHQQDNRQRASELTTLPQLITAGNRDSIKTWFEPQSISQINTAVANLTQAQRDQLTSIVVQTNVTGTDREKILTATKKVINNRTTGFYAEIWSYTPLTILPGTGGGHASCRWLEATIKDATPETILDVLMHESLHSFNCVNGGPRGALDEGSSIWVFKIAFPLERSQAELEGGFAETVYGTVNFYRDYGVEGNSLSPLNAHPTPNAKSLELFNWLSASDPSHLPWDNQSKLQYCYDSYYKNILRTNPDWFNLAREASARMAADPQCKPAQTTTVAITAISPTPTATTSVEKPLLCGDYGDIDDDNKITNNDPKQIERIIAGFSGYTDIQKARAELDNNNLLDLRDVRLLRVYLAGDNTPFPICATLATSTPISITKTPTQASGWTNSGNIFLSDNAYSRYSFDLLNTNGISQPLISKGYGFNIPSGSTINGIQVEVERRSSSSDGPSDNTIYLVKSSPSILFGTAILTTTRWPLADTYATYGSSTNLWGTPITVQDVNDVNFGVAVKAKSTRHGSVGYIDHVKMTVTYTPQVTVTPTPILACNSTCSVDSDCAGVQTCSACLPTPNGVGKSCQPPVTQPPAPTLSLTTPTSVTTNSVNIQATITKPSTSSLTTNIRYSTTNGACNTFTLFSTTTHAAGSVTATYTKTIPGLQPNTTYYVCLEGFYGSGSTLSTLYSSIQTFKTLATTQITPTSIPSPTSASATISCPPGATNPNTPLKARGDANCSGTITLADYNIWRDEFIAFLAGSSGRTKYSDFSVPPNDISLGDYNIWRDNFILTLP